MSQPHSPKHGSGRRSGGGGRKKELLHFHLRCPLPKPEESKGEKGCRVHYLFSLEHGKKVSHSPFPFIGGVYFNQQPLLHPPYVCTHIPPQLGGVTQLTQSSYLFLRWRGFDKWVKGRSHIRQRFQATEWRKGGREEQHQRPGESGKGHSFFVFKKFYNLEEGGD